MKNKVKKLIFLFLLSVFFTSNIVGEEIKFEANFIELIDEEKRIIAKKNVKIINDKETIYADEMDYDKSKQIIKAKGNVRIEHIEKNVETFSDELIYFKNKETISLNKNVRINFENKLLFNTQEVLYDKNKKQIITNNFSTFKDNFGNKISSEKTKYSFNQSLLKIHLVKMTDEIDNKYFFENAIIDLENNEIIGDIEVAPSKIKSLKVNKSFYVNSTDEYPIMFVIAALTPGVSIFKGVSGLKNKESNRVIEMQKILSQVGIKSVFVKDILKIFGKKEIKNVGQVINVSSILDHRICMSALILSLVTGIKSKINNFETVRTSSPNFLKIIKSLGGKYEIK